MIASRRGFITGLAALIAAPAVVKAASLMRIAPTEIIKVGSNPLLTIDQITREMVRLLCDTNAYIMELDRQYEQDFQFFKDDSWEKTPLLVRVPQVFTVRQ